MKFEGHWERYAWRHSSITAVTRGQEEAPAWNEVRVLFALSWLPSLVL